MPLCCISTSQSGMLILFKELIFLNKFKKLLQVKVFFPIEWQRASLIHCQGWFLSQRHKRYYIFWHCQWGRVPYRHSAQSNISPCQLTTNYRICKDVCWHLAGQVFPVFRERGQSVHFRDLNWDPSAAEWGAGFSQPSRWLDHFWLPGSYSVLLTDDIIV